METARSYYRSPSLPQAEIERQRRLAATAERRRNKHRREEIGRLHTDQARQHL
jgi:hypothetical protein